MSADAQSSVRSWVMDPGRMRWLTAAAIAVFLGSLVGFAALADHLGTANGFSANIEPGGVVDVRVAPTVSFSLHAGGAAPFVALLAAGGEILTILVITVLFLLLHEYCHGLAFRWAGARPCYGFKLVGRIYPVFYTTAPGRWFTRDQYRINALAPTVGVNLVGITLLCLAAPWVRELLILPLAIHLSGCVGDWWMLLVLSGFPSGTQVEDTKNGFSYRMPD